MNRIRISTTVDGELLSRARVACGGDTDAALIDEALRAFLARRRSSEIDAAYAAYDEHPLDEPDEWGDLSLRLIEHGRRVCDARRPRCDDCVLAGVCPSAFKV